ADPGRAVAGVRHFDTPGFGTMVSPALGGDGPGTYRAAPQPRQPARGQTKDVQVEEETPRTSQPTAFEENLCGDGSYHLTSGIALSPGGRRRAASSKAERVKLGDPGTGQDVLTLKGHPDEVQCVAFSPDGTRLASASEDGMVKIWDARLWTPESAREREVL